MWLDVMDNLLRMILLLLIINILRNIVHVHVHVHAPIPFSPYIAARFAVAAAAAPGRHYRVP